MSARRGLAGERLHRWATALFDANTVERLIEPALADLQRSLAAAPARGPSRWRVAAREYGAVCQLLAVALVFPRAGAGAPLTALLMGRSAAGTVALLTPALFVAFAWLFRDFVAGTVVAGIAWAFVVAWWNHRHPTTVARTRAPGDRDPEINLSAIPVGGDAGGALFVVASALAVLLGLPALRSFVAAAVISGLAWAWLLVRYRRRAHAPDVLHVVGR